jgi:DeoR/GlpR family transcriptional regulator of sugar metabolism
MFIESPSLSESIVAFLKRYGTVPVGFLAKQHKRGVEEIESYLTNLEEKGVIIRDGDRVSLQPEAQSIAGSVAGED